MSGSRLLVSLARLSQAVFFPVWFMHGSIDWLVRVGLTPEENVSALPPGLSLGRMTLPWAAVMISQTAAAVLPHDRGRGSACARAVDASTSHGVGISVTARTPNACGWSGAGRRRSGRPSGVRTRRPKPSTPRPNVRAVSVPSLRHNHPKTAEVAAARGHAAKIFLPTPLCDRPGCYEPPPKSGRNQATLLLPACRQAVRRVRDRERKWLLPRHVPRPPRPRAGVPGRPGATPRPATRHRQHDAATDAASVTSVHRPRRSAVDGLAAQAA